MARATNDSFVRSVPWSRSTRRGRSTTNYLWFYERVLTPERNLQEVEEIVKTLMLAPGSSILDAPCGHGRIANLLAAQGFLVTGVDLTELFLEHARTALRSSGSAWITGTEIFGIFLSPGHSTRLSAGSRPSATSMTTTTGRCSTSSPGCSGLAAVYSSRRCTMTGSFAGSSAPRSRR